MELNHRCPKIFLLLALMAWVSVSCDELRPMPTFSAVPCVAYVRAKSTVYDPNGRNWVLAFPTLHQGIDLAASMVASGECPDGASVWITGGTYYPSIGGLENSRDATFQLVERVSLYGGFHGNFLEESPDDRPEKADGPETILSGDLSSQGFSGNSYHVVTGANEVVMDRITIAHGYAKDQGNLNAETNYGGGLINIAVSPTLRDCKFVDNEAQEDGGAVYNLNTSSLNSSPTFDTVRFEGNRANGKGGAVANNNSSPLLHYCRFKQNWAGTSGGAVSNNAGSAPYIYRSTFEENEASTNQTHLSMGGAIFNQGTTAYPLEKCYFYYNIANMGGAIHAGSSSDISIKDSHFRGNWATHAFDGGGGGAVSVKANSTATIVSSYFLLNVSSQEHGGAVRIEDASVTLINNTFGENYAQNSHGGAIYGVNADATITNSVFYSNDSEIDGGALGLMSDASFLVTNCTFVGNTRTDIYDNVYTSCLWVQDSNLTVTNSILWPDPKVIDGVQLTEEGTNNISITHTNIHGGWPESTCINVDPLFVDPPFDFGLLGNSECIDAGDDSALPTDETDLDGDQDTDEPIPHDYNDAERIVGDAVDMGAVEYQGPSGDEPGIE